MLDLESLQHKISEARGEIHQSNFRTRIAKADIASELLKNGVSPCKVSDWTNLSKSEVLAEQARLEERERPRRRFLSTGDPGYLQSSLESGYHAILQR